MLTRRLTLLCLLIVAAYAIRIGAAADAPPDARGGEPRPLIANGDFERDQDGDGAPDGWSVPAGASFAADAEGGGGRFLRLQVRQPGETVLVYQAVTLKPDDALLRLSYRVRFEDVKVGTENYFDGRIMMNFKDAKGNAVRPGPKAPSFRGSSKGWKPQSQDIAVPEGAQTLELMFTLFKAERGTLDFDDVALVSVPGGKRVTAAPPPATKPAAFPRPVAAPPAEKLPKELRVVGNQIQTVDGKTVWLQGLSIPSLEWSARGDYVIESVDVATRDWKSNAIRLPVRDDKWFGKDKYQKDGGKAYRELVDDAVNLAASRGAYLVLDLHQFRAPTAEHAAFWTDAATRYKNHPAVLFELLNEPHGISWEVWRDGGAVTDKPKASDALAENAEKPTSFQSVGMQRLVDAVRATGAKNIVIAGGLDWGYDLSGVLKGFALDDRGGNGVVYSSHVYPWKGDWPGKFLAVAEKHPVFIGELGAEVERMPFIPPERHEDPYTWSPDMLGLIQKHKLHWTGWCFHPKSTPRVIADWGYAPTPFWGAFVKRALAGEQFEVKRMR